jgi:hypothetical protein
MARGLRRVPFAVLLASAAGLALAQDAGWPVARAEEPAATPPKSPEAEEEEVPTKDATPEEAAARIVALEAASKKKAKDVLLELLAWKGLRHESFLKPLTKLLRHENDDVAYRATILLERQKPTGPDEKTAAKNVDKALRELWKLAFQQSVNDRRWAVKGGVVKLHGAWGVTLDEKEFDEVKGIWRSSLGNSDPRRASALVNVTKYVGLVKDKRFSRLLAEMIDEPRAGDVNSASNPPASYWEALWKAWDAMRPHVHAALKALTGQEFKTTADAKKWFEENERSYGFKW